MSYSPALSLSAAHSLTALFTLTYVSSIYLSQRARLSFSSTTHRLRAGPHTKAPAERWRDDPDVIKARLLAVSFATCACCLGVLLAVWHWSEGPDPLNITISLLGFVPFYSVNILTYLPIPLLFLGPFYVRFFLVGTGGWSGWWHNVAGELRTWVGIRNYIMAPLTEEVVFRACILAVYHLAGASPTRMIFLCPLSFGAAHIHHAWETFNRYGRTPAAAQRAVIVTLFQLSYTTFFGSLASFLFVRTGALAPPLVAHMWCNAWGLPQLGAEVRAFPRHKSAIHGAYVAGIVLFCATLGPWTRTTGSVYWPTPAA